MKMKSTYGNTRTHLTLTGKAEEFYNLSDPITIIETEENGVYSYLVLSGNEPMHDGYMTEEQLVRFLEDGYDEYISGCTFRIKPEYIDQWGEEATEDTVLTYQNLKDITRGWDKTPEDIMHQLIIE